MDTSTQADENTHIVEGQFGQSVRVRQSTWYFQQLIELLPHDGAVTHGGQVLLTPEQAVDLIAVLSQVIADAKAVDSRYSPASTPEEGQR